MSSETNPERQDSTAEFFGGQRAAIIGLAALIFLALLLRYTGQTPQGSDPGPLPIVVDIRGAVEDPGVYLFHMPSVTVAEAIKTAGGLRQGTADTIPQRFAHAKLHTGQRVQVVVRGQDNVQVHLQSMPAGARLALGQKLDLNRATAQQLLLIPKMKPDFATAIVERRRQRPWTGLDELREIPGVGPKTIRKWADYLEVVRSRP